MTQQLPNSAKRVQDFLVQNGHTSPLRTILDHDLRRYDTIWAAAGTPFVAALRGYFLVK